MKPIYPPADPKPSFPKIEEEIIEFWKCNKIFEKSTECYEGQPEFVFYDGPPFANGLPHYGHIVTGYVKDIVPRYQTMRGHLVERRFGWDCHGLPAEMQAEKELGISGRKKIMDYGIAEFNEYCKSTVLRYTQDWEQYVERQARWVDFQNDYKTMDITFMESIIWAFKELWKRGLIYKDYRVVPYSWAAESPLSNFETRLDNAYRSRQDPAVTVLFDLHPTETDPKPTKILVWTTTPWTLPSNLALAVGKDIDYSVYEENGVRYIVGAAVVSKYEKQLANAVCTGTIKGKELVGRSYTPLFDFFKDTPNAFQVLSADFVNTEEGTGTVHLAPGFGEDDLNVCRAYGIPVVCPVDTSGCFTSEVPPFEGQLVLEANKPIIRDLKDRQILIKHETYTHNYPYCWRTDEPLIYKAIDSWYLKVTEIRDRMVELNKSINWIPEHIRDGQFGRWLENARDWNISRNRFWGVPIPVWVSDNPQYPRVDVYGSLDELEKDFGVRPDNLHRPMIDNLTRPNPDDPTGKSTMRRVEEVFDCWFESGSMPFAQVHYPFENKDWFENHFPGDFIVEYIAQTRGWFYTMMVLSTALFDRAPFRNCMCHGVVLAENGEKMSKRLRNYPDPMEVFNTLGSDALRWFMISSPLLTGGDLEISKDARAIAQTLRLTINPIWNAFYFFTLYANADQIRAEAKSDSKVLLDRYILSKTRSLVVQVTELMDSYDIPNACTVIERYMDALNNWFIRRSRERFWRSEQDQDKQNAYNTLYTALTVLCRIAAPLLPLITERIYKNLTGEVSVHLAHWPHADELPSDDALVSNMDAVRDICSSALSIREARNLRVRLPLQSITITGIEQSRIQPYVHLIQDEINIKEVKFTDTIEQFGALELSINQKIGSRLGSAMKEVMAASKQNNWKKIDDEHVEVAGHILTTGDYTLRIIPAEGLAVQTLSDRKGAVALDIAVTPELEKEGIARDIIRLIQTTRKDVDLNISDHIHLTLSLPADAQEAVSIHLALICEHTLTDSIAFGVTDQCNASRSYELNNNTVHIGIDKA